MANSDKNILITPSVGLSTNPTIKFNGANNTPTTLRVLDDGTVSFEGTAGQLFSISDGLTGSIFSVNDISGIPSIEALDTGLVKINQYNGSTTFGSSSPIQNSSLVNSKVSISTVSASTPGLIIKGAASQTANLQEWQNSAAVSVAQISATGTISTKPVPYSGNQNSAIISVTDRSSTWSAGNFAFRSDSGGIPRFSFTAPNAASEALSINGNSVGVQTPSPTAVFQVTSNSASNVVSIIKGAASQTANLTQWQDSAGSLAAWIGFDGRTYLAYSMIGTWNLDAMQTIYSNSASRIGSVIRGAASQTADLQQWQDSTGTVLAEIMSNGSFFVNSTGTSNDPITIQRGSTTRFKVDPYGNVFAGNLTAGNVVTSIAGTTVGVYTNIASNIGLIVRGAASQTANLQEWQNSAGTSLVSVSSSGDIFSSSRIVGFRYGRFGNDISYTDDAPLRVSSNGASTVVSVTKGATSQTANLQEWQNSAGTVLSKIDSAGALTVPSATIAYVNFYSNGNTSFGGTTQTYNLTAGSSTSVGTFTVTPTSASTVGQVIRGAASQTANLQEWQASDGTVRAAVDANGFIVAGAGSSISNAVISARPFGASQVGVAVRGAASQTADLQQWQDSSGNVAAKIGPLYGSNVFQFDPFSYGAGAGYSQIVIGGRSITNEQRAAQSKFGVTTGEWALGALRATDNQVGAFAVSTTLPTLTVKAAASQTANLQEWQNSSGTVLTKVDSSGNITAPDYRLSNSLYTIRKNIKKTVDPAGSALANNTYDLFQIAFPSSLQGVFAIQVSIRNSGYGQSMSYTLPVTYVMDWLAQYGITNPFTDSTTWVDLTPITFAPRHLMTNDYLKFQARVSSNTIFFRIKLTGQLTSNPLFDVYIQHSEEFANTTITELFSTGTDSTTANVMPNFLSSKAGTSAIFNPLTVSSSVASNVPLTIKGFTSQSGSLTEWQNSSGQVRMSVSSFGSLLSNAAAVFNNTLNGTGTSLITTTTDPGGKPLVVKGAASQTANLQEWQTSTGSILGKLDKDGKLTTIDIESGALNATWRVYSTAGAPTVVPITAKGAASQTANLQEWQNSAGTVLGYIGATGGAKFAGLDVQMTGSAIVNIGTAASSLVGLIVRGVASQTADLQQWQNSAGIVQSRMTDIGKLFSNYLQSSYGILTGSATYAGGYNFISNPSFATTDVSLIVKAVSSQTSDLQQWQNSSGTVLAEITASGSLELNGKDIELMNIMGAF